MLPRDNAPSLTEKEERLANKQSDSQSTHRAAENESITLAVKNLKKLYPTTPHTLPEIINYIEKNKDALIEAGYDATASNEKIINFLKMIQGRLHFDEGFNREALMKLIWCAALDQNQVEFEFLENPAKVSTQSNVDAKQAEQCDSHIITKRLAFFLNDLAFRLKQNPCIQGQYNAIYEAFQGLHPLAPKILDLAAVNGLIPDLFKQSVEAFLDKKTLPEQLKIIKLWFENIDNDKFFVNSEDEKKQIEEIFNQHLIKRGYKALAQNELDKYFTSTPESLQEFELLAEIYPSMLNAKENHDDDNDSLESETHKNRSSLIYFYKVKFFNDYFSYCLKYLTVENLKFALSALKGEKLIKLYNPNNKSKMTTFFMETVKEYFKTTPYFLEELSLLAEFYPELISMNEQLENTATEEVATQNRINLINHYKDKWFREKFDFDLNNISPELSTKIISALRKQPFYQKNKQKMARSHQNIIMNETLIFMAEKLANDNNWDALRNENDFKILLPESDQDLMWLICNAYRKSSIQNRIKLIKLIKCLKDKDIHPQHCYFGGQSAADLLLKAGKINDSGEAVRYGQIMGERYLAKNENVHNWGVWNKSIVSEFDGMSTQEGILTSVFVVSIFITIMICSLIVGSGLFITLGLFVILPIVFGLSGLVMLAMAQERQVFQIIHDENENHSIYKQPSSWENPLIKTWQLLSKCSPYQNRGYNAAYRFYEGKKHLLWLVLGEDVLLPCTGLLNVLSGLGLVFIASIISACYGDFKQAKMNLIDGLITFASGVLELAVTPFVYLKIPIRLIVTCFYRFKHEQNKLKAAADSVANTINNVKQNDSENTPLLENQKSPSTLTTYRKLYEAAGNIHRQYKNRDTHNALLPAENIEQEKWTQLKVDVFSKSFSHSKSPVSQDMEKISEYCQLFRAS